jgi:hypothetical protein
VVINYAWGQLYFANEYLFLKYESIAVSYSLEEVKKKEAGYWCVFVV